MHLRHTNRPDRRLSIVQQNALTPLTRVPTRLSLGPSVGGVEVLFVASCLLGVKYGILSNNRYSKLHAVIDCLLFLVVDITGKNVIFGITAVAMAPSGPVAGRLPGAENKARGFGGKRGVRSAECGKCGVWKMRSVENAECGKRGVWKMRGVENAECGKCVENFNFPSHFVIPMWINNV